MKEYFPRKIRHELVRLSDLFPVILMTGPRQSGKTTLCKREFFDFHYVNLENIGNREAIMANPTGFLEEYGPGGVVIDEVQNSPDFLSYIQVVIDENPDYKIILTGSNNFSLMQSVTQSLAGRVGVLTLLPLSLQELRSEKTESTDTLMVRGGYPAVWGREIPVWDVAQNYYSTYIERDVRQLINIRELSHFQTFIKLCAGRIGTEFKASALSNAIGVSTPTIQEWLGTLEASYILFRLPPFYRNIGKRLIKTPKIYFYDTGLVCFLLGIENEKQLSTHPLHGLIFENMVVLEFLKNRFNGGKLSNLYFYRDKSQNEVDLIQEFGKDLHTYEIKSAKIFNRDFLRTLTYFREVIGEDVKIAKVIYDGDISMNTSINGIVNFRDIKFTDQEDEA